MFYLKTMNSNYLIELRSEAESLAHTRDGSLKAESIRVKLEDALRELDLYDDRMSSIDFSKSIGFNSSKNLMVSIIESKIRVLQIRLNKERIAKSETESKITQALNEAENRNEEYLATIQRKDEQIESLNGKIAELKDQILISQTELKNILVDIDKITGSVKKLID